VIISLAQQLSMSGLAAVSDAQPFGYFSPTTSLWVFAGMVAVNVLLVCVPLYRWLKNLFLARRAERGARRLSAGRDLAPGEVVLKGVVEYARGESLAVRVEIEQVGSEEETRNEDSDSGIVTVSYAHDWTESHRKMQVRPFYLRLGEGQRVRIEPPPNVRLNDRLDGMKVVAQSKRIRIAELSPGERIYAIGTLSRGMDTEGSPAAANNVYRGVAIGEGWILRPTRKEMLLSSLPLGFGYRARAMTFLMFLVGALLVTPINGCMHAGYGSRLLMGEAQVGHVVEGKSRCNILVDDKVYSDDGATKCFMLREGNRAWVVIAPGSWQQGRKPMLEMGVWYFLGMFAVLGWFGALFGGLFFGTRSNAAWYLFSTHEGPFAGKLDPKSTRIE
jgi:hypothetical protein